MHYLLHTAPLISNAALALPPLSSTLPAIKHTRKSPTGLPPHRGQIMVLARPDRLHTSL